MKTKITNTTTHKDIQVTEGKLVLIQIAYSATPNVGIVGFGLNHYKPIIISETEEIEVGDWFWAQGSIDKAVEGTGVVMIEHTGHNIRQRTHRGLAEKIIVLPEQFSPQQLRDIVEGKLKDGDKVLIECQCYDERWNSTLNKISYYQVKLSSQGHVTLHKVEDKIYTPDQMLDLITTFNISTSFKSVEEAKAECPKLFETKRQAAKDWLEKL